jgi:predicted NAD/FAD-binding protein
MRIAIVGSGISGLVCAHLLQERHEVVLFESEDRLGGHSDTHHVELDDCSVDVDTGFLVFNERTYPLFTKLLARLDVASQPSDMSFGVADARTGLEWRGTSLSSVFAQRSNVAKPAFVRMLNDVRRFNKLARSMLEGSLSNDLSLEEVLESGNWSAGFREWYLIPLGSSIWSADPRSFLRIPAVTCFKFFERHGLLRLRDQPDWRTVSGGSRNYVEAIAGPLRAAGRVRLSSSVDKIVRHRDRVELEHAHGVETFDHVIVATHSDQALRILSDPSRSEREVLGSIRYQHNQATLHTDARLLPRTMRARASWNYQRGDRDSERATLTYYLNRLQSIPSKTPLLVTLNQEQAMDPDTVLARMDYAHPVLDRATVAAQSRRGEINGTRRTWFAGAYWGNGFHEDGVRSGADICRELGVSM